MFGMGFSEILVIAVIGLLVFGPEKLPEAIRTFAFGLSKAKRTWQNTRRELEQELGMDEIRREIHNAQITVNLEKSKISTKSKPEEADSADDQSKSDEEPDNQEIDEQDSEKQNPDLNLGEHVDNQELPETSSESESSDQTPKASPPEEK